MIYFCTFCHFPPKSPVLSIQRLRLCLLSSIFRNSTPVLHFWWGWLTLLNPGWILSTTRCRIILLFFFFSLKSGATSELGLELNPAQELLHTENVHSPSLEVKTEQNQKESQNPAPNWAETTRKILKNYWVIGPLRANPNCPCTTESGNLIKYLLCIPTAVLISFKK